MKAFWCLVLISGAASALKPLRQPTWRQEGNDFYEEGKIWRRPPNWASMNCGPAAGRHCKPWVCVERHHQPGVCTYDSEGWKWRTVEASVERLDTRGMERERERDRPPYPAAGTVRQIDDTTYMDEYGKTWTRPADWRAMKCGPAAGRDCRPWVCVDRSYGAGRCTYDASGWHWNPERGGTGTHVLTYDGDDSLTGRRTGTADGDTFVDERGRTWTRHANWREMKCGAEAGRDCRQWVCVDRSYGGGYCTYDTAGWHWNPEERRRPIGGSGGTMGGGGGGSQGGGSYTQNGNQFTDSTGHIWTRDANWRSMNCGRAAGRHCEPWVCVERSAGPGRCTYDPVGWHWFPTATGGGTSGGSSGGFGGGSSGGGSGLGTGGASSDGYGTVTSRDDGRTWTDERGRTWHRPENWRDMKCGAQAGRHCKPWICVEQRYRSGYCTYDSTGWTWNED